ncbi:hypothetical protein ARMGADRAFT_1070734 [Armillaria gallica]|uniref:Uncharacterized protein n=1 Tax=Armillaria gallica TaxID=47427 RepID=A0A2H3F0Z5_ARMGA|nr:hypothetical protein ARMGADRAFT_1070734 [Armillaria gallica]
MAKKRPTPNTQSTSTTKRQNTGYRSNTTIPVPSTSTTSAPSVPSTSGSNPPSHPCTPGIGGLTDPMREYLDKHKSCRKCCHVNVGHISNDCTLGFPDPATYWGIMLTDSVILAPDALSLNSVASITVNDTSHIASGPVTVISSSLPVSSQLATNTSCIIGEDDNLSVDSDNEATHPSNRSVSLPPHFDKVCPICAVSTSPEVPFALDHLVWPCAIKDRSSPSKLPSYIQTSALIDDGSHLVLIRPELVAHLKLKIHPLPKPISVTVAFQDASSSKTSLTSWVKLKLHAHKNQWSSHTVHAIIALNLCTDIILGLPFLATNKLLINPSERSVIDKTSGFDLLHPSTMEVTTPLPSHHSTHNTLCTDYASTDRLLPFHMLSSTDTAYTVLDDPNYNKLRDSDPICAIRECIELLKF